jgi:hypothetical protein
LTRPAKRWSSWCNFSIACGNLVGRIKERSDGSADHGSGGSASLDPPYSRRDFLRSYELVGRTAGLTSADEVVDVGFGFAQQDIYWTRRFAPRRIIGVNIAPEQVRLARARVRKLGLEERIDLREGSATATGLPDACCDVVTAVECAFHFETRERFRSIPERLYGPFDYVLAAARRQGAETIK